MTDSPGARRELDAVGGPPGRAGGDGGGVAMGRRVMWMHLVSYFISGYPYAIH
jgi:hypothetical protein